MSEFGKRKDGRYYPKNARRNGIAIERSLTPRDVESLTGVGITHPGSLTKYGYHINEGQARRKAALSVAVKTYGRKEVLRKLGELYRLDYNRPHLRQPIVNDIRFVSGGKRND